LSFLNSFTQLSGKPWHSMGPKLKHGKGRKGKASFSTFLPKKGKREDAPLSVDDLGGAGRYPLILFFSWREGRERKGEGRGRCFQPAIMNGLWGSPYERKKDGVHPLTPLFSLSQRGGRGEGFPLPSPPLPPLTITGRTIKKGRGRKITASRFPFSLPFFAALEMFMEKERSPCSFLLLLFRGGG